MGTHTVAHGVHAVTALTLSAVPCYRRCHQISEVRSNEKCIHLSEDDEEGWVDTHHGMSERVGSRMSCDCHVTHDTL